jgi:beta-lactam-binding protein with PASTA domain
VDLVVSLGEPQVPDVVGETEPNATTAITAVDNLTVGAIVYEYNDTVPATVVISQNPAAGTLVPIGSSVDLVVSSGQPQAPDVVGETEPNAVVAITAVDNLTVGTVTYDYNDTVPATVVISQNPAAGTLVPIGSSIDLVVSLGQPQVPDVVGQTEPNAAAAIIVVDNLTVGTIVYEYNDTIAATVVISQDPAAGTLVPIGSSVDLVVSLGQPQVPDVVGETEPNAAVAITAVDNLTVGTVSYDYNDSVPQGLVISQNPAAGVLVPIGSSVDLVISSGQPQVPDVVGETEPNVISQNPAAGTLVPIGSSVDLVVSLGQPQVPDVVGETEPNAAAAITSVDNLTVGAVSYQYSETVPAGLVISQTPSAGTLVPIGSSVDLVISGAVVPGVVGETEPNASSAITAAGLTVGSVDNEYNDTVKAGNIISQNPLAGTILPVGSSVDLLVSLGKPEVPDVVGMSQAAAHSSITAVDNLTVGTVTYEYSDTVDPGLVISQDPNGETLVPIGSSVDLVVSLGKPQVPNVVGETEPNAAAAIIAVDNLTVGAVDYEYSETVPEGRVISQDPAAGTLVLIGSSVDLVVSLGQSALVPGVIGQSEANAVSAINDASLEVGTVTYDYSDTVAAGLVISQDPVGGTLVPIGSSVDLVVSLGQPEVPDVVGRTEPNATAVITGVDNLTVGTIVYEYNDTIAATVVISQNPAAGTTVPIGSSVDLVVSLGQPQVPDVVGETEPNAAVAITGVDNLTVGSIS